MTKLKKDVIDEATLARMLATVARVSVGASTAQKMGPKGTIDAARAFLGGVDLRNFAVRTNSEFLQVLDRNTTELASHLPETAQHWGSSRKFLNIFLRNCFYNKYLCKAYGLGEMWRWMEVPLDSHVAKALRAQPEGKGLPRWKTVIGLSKPQSDDLQSVASDVAARLGIARVHLDVHYWNGPLTTHADTPA